MPKTTQSNFLFGVVEQRCYIDRFGSILATVKCPRVLEQHAREILMRRITGAIAVLLILGLAAVGFSSAQKKTIDSSSAMVVSDSPAASTSEAAATALRRTPDNEHFQRDADGATIHSAEPTRMAEATTAPVVPNTPTPSASTQNKPEATALQNDQEINDLWAYLKQFDERVCRMHGVLQRCPVTAA
jgi:hypothetical protein